MSIFDEPTEARLIANSILENPDEWAERGEYCIVHSSGLQIWVGNGAWGVKPWGSTTRFDANWREKRVIWKAYSSWRRKRLSMALKKSNTEEPIRELVQ